MGFRNGAYAKVWSVEPETDTRTKVRLSTSRKNRQTGQYEQDFSGFVQFVGTANATSASRLHEGDRIKLGDCDVTTRYNKETKREYVNYTTFGFEKMEDDSSGGSGGKSAGKQKDPPYDEPNDDDLPF